jgi:peptide/nickel transport system substrate-binding protein
MRRWFWLVLVASACAVATFVVTACGGGNGGGKGQKGGTLTMLTNGDVDDALDPGYSYYQLDFIYNYAVERPVISYKPDDTTKASPDVASEYPTVSKDGKTVTIHLKKGIKFGPPVNREVTSRDVKYAIERGFNANVANPYASTYYGDLVGGDRADGGPIPGLQTPDDHTLVFKLTRPTASLVAQSTVLPLSAPVPAEYAKPLDAKAPSQYGSHLVSSGPYTIPADGDGKVLGEGYVPGRSLRLVRNPSWRAATDHRPAYLDEIDFKIGGSPTVSGRQVLAGRGLALADPPTPALVKKAYQQARDQIYFSPGGGSRYAALNTTIPPFDDANVRKAVGAALDREQMRRVRGGEVIGDIASHFLYPGVQGFEQAGGLDGTGVDFLAHPEGDRALAARYMRAAGYPDGRYTGDETIQVVGLAGAPDSNDAQIFDQTLQDLGFKTSLKLVDSTVMYGRFCGVPRARVHVCPNVGWIRDFADPQTVLDLAFNGNDIFPENNPNWPQLNDAAINRAMARAELTVGDAARARAWADIDRQVTATAAAIPWLWDRQPNVFAADVRCVPELWNQGHCDFAYTSLK